jgi:hypothetical protein
MKILLVLFIAMMAAGCGNANTGSEGDPTEAQQALRRGVFWQFVQPRIQLDPIEEEEFPVVITPVKMDE